jgi:hypothetical protein
MNHSERAGALLKPWLTWGSFALSAGEMMLSAAQVVGHRVPRLAAAAAHPYEPLSARDHAEFTRMVAEKGMAFGESWMAMSMPFWFNAAGLGMRLQTLTWQSWLRNLQGMTAGAMPGSSATSSRGAVRRAVLAQATAAAHMSDAAGKLATRGLAPVHRRAKANARRLARK